VAERDPQIDRGRRPWSRSERAFPRVIVRPLERFLKLEAGSASLLMAAALAALLWANLAASSYEEFWATEVTIEVGSLHFEEDLLHLVNDLLMAVFFYVVALEVKRELLFGSLRQPRSAAVPVAAAVGTMVGGALVYLVVNVNGGEPAAGPFQSPPTLRSPSAFSAWPVGARRRSCGPSCSRWPWWTTWERSP
jgi:Na+:H+ antiporter, NhaA family